MASEHFETKRSRFKNTSGRFDALSLSIPSRIDAAADAKQEAEPSEHAYGKLVLLSDPFGHGVCLLQFEGYDAIADRIARRRP